MKKEAKKETLKISGKSVKKDTKKIPKKEGKHVSKKTEKKAVGKEIKKSETKVEEIKNRNILYEAFPKVLQEPRGDRWKSFIDGSKGTISSVLKYKGQLLSPYLAEDMDKEKLQKFVKGVVKFGSNIIFDCQEVQVNFHKFIDEGILPKEILSPKLLISEEMAKKLREPDEEYFLPNPKGEIYFIFTNPDEIPEWAKKETELIFVAPPS